MNNKPPSRDPKVESTFDKTIPRPVVPERPPPLQNPNASTTKNVCKTPTKKKSSIV